MYVCMYVCVRVCVRVVRPEHDSFGRLLADERILIHSHTYTDRCIHLHLRYKHNIHIYIHTNRCTYTHTYTQQQNYASHSGCFTLIGQGPRRQGGGRGRCWREGEGYGRWGLRGTSRVEWTIECYGVLCMLTGLHTLTHVLRDKFVHA